MARDSPLLKKRGNCIGFPQLGASLLLGLGPVSLGGWGRVEEGVRERVNRVTSSSPLLSTPLCFISWKWMSHLREGGSYKTAFDKVSEVIWLFDFGIYALFGAECVCTHHHVSRTFVHTPSLCLYFFFFPTVFVPPPSRLLLSVMTFGRKRRACFFFFCFFWRWIKCLAVLLSICLAMFAWLKKCKVWPRPLQCVLCAKFTLYTYSFTQACI